MKCFIGDYSPATLLKKVSVTRRLKRLRDCDRKCVPHCGMKAAVDGSRCIFRT